MKKLFYLLLLIFCYPICYAQGQFKPTQLSFAYYGNVINEQGARVSTQFYVHSWKAEGEGKKAKEYLFFVQPNLGFISRPLF